MLGNATVTVRTTTTTRDSHGDSTTSTSETVLDWAVISPLTSTERDDSRSPAVVTAASLLAPYETELDSDDTVIVANHSAAFDGEWRVDGIPGPWASPFSDWRPGLEVALARAGNV